VDSNEHGNEMSNFVTGEEFRDYVRDCYLLH
jgi:hypothetical protein